MKRKTVTTLTGITLMSGLAFAAILNMTAGDSRGQDADGKSDSTESYNTAKPVSVEVTRPQRRPLTRSLRMPATLLAGEMADLYAKTSGYVSRVPVDIGDRVARGDVLLVIDVPEMADELRETEAVLEAKRAKIVALKAKAAQAEAMIRIAQSQIGRAKAEYELRKITFGRNEELRNAEAIPQQGLDEARSLLDIADADSRIAEAHVAGAEAEEAAVRADVRVAESQAAVAEAAVARLITLMGYTSIRAPFDGLITERLVDPGAFVRSAVAGSTTPLLRISRVDFIRLTLEIPESDAPYVRRGSGVEIDVKALRGAPIHAKITRTAGAIKPATRTMRAEVELKNPDHRLAPGMYAQVTIELETRQNALLIPSKAIRVRGRKISVLVAGGNIVESIPVRLGYDDGIWVEILEGLSGDERVIVSADNTVATGVRVNAVEIRPSESPSS